MENNQLVQVSTSDGLFLHGFYLPSKNKKTAVLHIHGFEGNFYENGFIYPLINEIEKSDTGLLIVNTRGNGKDTDVNCEDGTLKKIGARYELLEEAHLDISAWMKFLIDENYERIILMGHSLGTYKAVRYLFEGQYRDRVTKLILLSPFDQIGLMVASKRNLEELLKKAEILVAQGRGNELITKDFDDIELSYRTFISWYQQDNFGRMFEFCNKDYDFPILRQIKIPVKIIVGSKDEYFHQSNPDHPEEAMKILLKNIPNATGKIIKGAVHSFKPCETEMAKEVKGFVL